MRHSHPALTATLLGLILSSIALTAADTARIVKVTKTLSPSVATPAPQMVQKVAPAGTALYIAKRGESVISVARQFLSKTSYLTSAEVANAIRGANDDVRGTFLKQGQNVIVPGILPAPIAEKTIPVAKDFEVRAVYLTGLMAASDHGIAIVKHWREVGGNAVVFDIKDSDGTVNIPFEHPLLGKHHITLHDLPKYVHFLHSQNMHAIARIAIFRDERLVKEHPEVAVQSRKNNAAWRENGKLVWTDPSNPKIQEYNIALAKTAAASGVDEVQFDYVRFPAEGDQKDAKFVFQSEHSTGQRADVIADFVKHAHEALQPSGVLLSLDVFGVMAWQRSVDLNHTGQDIVRMAKYCDVLSPMIYPSHFFGMDNIARPGDAPEHFIGVSMDRFGKITQGSGVVIRPWLQAFHWRTRTYSPEYIKVQVLTAKNKGGVGFLFWNAANDYSKPYVAMPTMRSDKGKYFRGDELPAVAQASLSSGSK